MKRHGLGTPEVAGAADLEYLGVPKGIVVKDCDGIFCLVVRQLKYFGFSPIKIGEDLILPVFDLRIFFSWVVKKPPTN